MRVERHEHGKHGCRAEAVDDEQAPNLVVVDHRLDAAVRQRGDHAARSIEDLQHQQRPQELQGVDVEQHDEQQHAGQRFRHGVFEAVAPEVRVVPPPDSKEEGEGDREREKASHRVPQFAERARHLERDNQQRHCEGEHGVAEAFEPRHLVPPVREGLRSSHAAYCRGERCMWRPPLGGPKTTKSADREGRTRGRRSPTHRARSETSTARSSCAAGNHPSTRARP